MDNDIRMLSDFLNAYRNVPSGDIELITQHLEARPITRGDVLLAEGKVAKELFFVVSGILKIVSTSDKGTEVVQFFVKERKLCTILYSFQRSEVSGEAIVAATAGRLLVLTKTGLDAICNALPYFRQLIGSITQEALLAKIQVRNSLMGEEATARYRKFIARQADMLLRVPLSDVASYLGITQQSLSRIRRSIAG